MEKNKEYCGCITVDVEIKNIKKLRKKAKKLEKELRKAERLKKEIKKLKLKVFSRTVEQSAVEEEKSCNSFREHIKNRFNQTK